MMYTLKIIGKKSTHSHKNWVAINYYCNCQKFEFYNSVKHPKDVEEMANSTDPDQEQSDLGLCCLLRPICPNTYITFIHFQG